MLHAQAQERLKTQHQFAVVIVNNICVFKKMK